MSSIIDILTGRTPPQQSLIDWNTGVAMGQPNAQQEPQPQQQPQPQGVLNQAQEPGILQRMGIQTDNFTNRLGNALMAAGSRDPALTLLELQKADSMAAAAKRPKITPLADGAFSLITNPDGSTRVVKNEEVANYLGDMQSTKFQQAIEKIIAGKQAEVQAADAKDGIKRGGDAREQLNQSQALFDGWKQAKKIVEDQSANSPWKSKIQGALPGIAGFLGGDQVANNKFLQGLTVSETLLNTALTKGAISDAEMTLFKSPIPSLSDDREIWKKYIDDRMPVIQKLMDFQRSEAARAENPASRVTGGAGGRGDSPAPAASINPDQVRSAFGSFEPDVYEYRISNGTVQRRKK